jgi:23S rRNA pseudouridine1911/1915/1917 synthase
MDQHRRVLCGRPVGIYAMPEKENVSETVAQDSAGVRVDIFIKSREAQLSRTVIQGLIERSSVQVNGKPIKSGYKLKRGDRISWRTPEPSVSGLVPEDIALNIIFEDKDILVIDKPSGLVVHPGAGNTEHTLCHALLAHTTHLSSINQDRPGIVHRLDKDTSGVMVVAKNNAAHLALTMLFKTHDIERRYIALVEGVLEFEEGVIDVPIKRHTMDRRKMAVSWTDEAREAQTRYKVLKRFSDYTAVELFPQTGRTHQLRVHLHYLGHPVLGDPIYGRKKNFSRLALHAKDLGFAHPTIGKFVKFSSPLPEELRAAMPGVKLER